MSKNELVEQMPDFISNAKVDDDGFDNNIQDKTSFPSYAIAFGQSDVVAEGKMVPGKPYNRKTGEGVDEKLSLLFFKKDLVYNCPQDDKKGTVCRSYTRKEGLVWISDDIDKVAMEEFGVTQEDVDESRRGVTHQCNGCSFHPIDGWVDKKPPRCKEEHVYYFLDVTNGFDPEPKRLTIRDTNKRASEAIAKFDSLFINNLKRNLSPLYGGVFNVVVKPVKYSNDNNGFVWDLSFDSFIKNEEVFNHAADCLKEFEERRKEMVEKFKEGSTKEIETKHEKAEEETWDEEEEKSVWPTDE